MAKDEYDYIIANIPKIPYIILPEEDPDTNFDVDPERTMNDLQRDQLRELACLVFNIMHVLGVGASSGIDAWQHIVLGSDYDGLIEPMTLTNFCTDIKGYSVEEMVLKLMPGVERSYLHYHPLVGGTTLLPRTASGGIDTDALANKVSGIFYTNGRIFLKQWYEN